METRFPTASPTARRPTQGSGFTNPTAGFLTPANLPSCSSTLLPADSSGCA
jgi:hypothetical protein